MARWVNDRSRLFVCTLEQAGNAMIGPPYLGTSPLNSLVILLEVIRWFD